MAGRDTLLRSVTLVLLGSLALGGACAREPSTPSGTTAATQREAPAAPAAAQAAATVAPVPEHLRVLYPAVGGSASVLWVAYRAGSFARQGLDLELVPDLPSLATGALVAGELGISLAGAALPVGAFVEGARQLVLVGATAQKLDFSLVGRVASGPELRGKTVIAGRTGDVGRLSAEWAVQGLGLALSDVSFVTGDKSAVRYAALQSGGVDAAILQMPFVEIAQREGFRVLYDVGEAAQEFPTTVVVSRRDYVAANRDLVRRFLAGLAEGFRIYKDPAHAEEVTGWLAEYFQSNDLPMMALTREFYARRLADGPVITEPGVQNVLDLVAQSNPAARSIRPAELLDTGPLHEAMEGLGQR